MTRIFIIGLLCSTLLPAPVQGQGYVCAEGGGYPGDMAWTATVFGWMVKKALYGSALVIGTGASGDAAVEAFQRAGAASAAYRRITSADADSVAVYAAITTADIVWILGGDQWEYIAAWNGTLTETAIREVYQRGGVVGGTSAGLHILGEIIYDARYGSLSPREALQNPFHPDLSFTHDFLGLVPGVLFDSHFTERGRLGRLAVMLARLLHDPVAEVLAIGVDDRTALCVGPDLTATVRGEGAVTFLHASPATKIHLIAARPPVVTQLNHHQLTEGYGYDLTTRRVVDRPPGAEPVPSPAGPPEFMAEQLNGSAENHRRKGELWVDDGGDPSALFYGALILRDGDGVLGRTVLSTRTWNSSDFDENNVGGVQYALSLHPHWLGLYVDSGGQVETFPTNRLLVRPPAGPEPESSIIILDTWGLTSATRSDYVSSNQSVGPRQSSALEGAALHVLRPGWRYDAMNHVSRAPLNNDDMNGDACIGAADLGIALSSWGSVAGDDLNGDGVWDWGDLELLIALWEPYCR
ncbi:MAG: cyanophycinase [Acidobacteria bacterium]|nr:cyanophycinase [Acidobacteriota bacterium]